MTVFIDFRVILPFLLLHSMDGFMGFLLNPRCDSRIPCQISQINKTQKFNTDERNPAIFQC